jgi:hypothetical protein
LIRENKTFAWQVFRPHILSTAKSDCYKFDEYDEYIEEITKKDAIWSMIWQIL